MVVFQSHSKLFSFIRNPSNQFFCCINAIKNSTESFQIHHLRILIVSFFFELRVGGCSKRDTIAVFVINQLLSYSMSLKLIELVYFLPLHHFFRNFIFIPKLNEPEFLNIALYITNITIKHQSSVQNFAEHVIFGI